MLVLALSLPLYLGAGALAVSVRSPSVPGLIGISALGAIGLAGWALLLVAGSDRATRLVAVMAGLLSGAVSTYLLSLPAEEGGWIALVCIGVLITPLLIVVISLGSFTAGMIWQAPQNPEETSPVERTATGPNEDREDQLSSDSFSSLRSLSERQLQIQYTVASTLDAQAVGILALNGGLAAAAVAADTLLGHDWWLALIGLAISGGLCLMALGRNADRVGPNAYEEIKNAETMSGREMDQTIVIVMHGNLQKNKKHLTDKRRLTWSAVAILTLTIAVEIVVMRVS